LRGYFASINVRANSLGQRFAYLWASLQALPADNNFTE